MKIVFSLFVFFLTLLLPLCHAGVMAKSFNLVFEKKFDLGGNYHTLKIFKLFILDKSDQIKPYGLKAVEVKAYGPQPEVDFFTTSIKEGKEGKEDQTILHVPTYENATLFMYHSGLHDLLAELAKNDIIEEEKMVFSEGKILKAMIKIK
jgi:hypothetical protein